MTALGDPRDGPGAYTITAIADAYAQLDDANKDNNAASVDVIVRGRRVGPVE